MDELSDNTFVYAAVAAAGFASGVINSMAGGGSLIALPVLMLLGLDANIANGTNRLAVVAQSASGVWLFQREGKVDQKAILPIVTPTIAGAIIGVLVAVFSPNEVIEPVIMAILVIMAVLMLFRPNAFLPPVDEEPLTLSQNRMAIAGLFFAGIYGGFIQGGVGILLLLVIGGMLRYDPVRANALKLVCTLLFGTVALAAFIYWDQVAWIPSIVLAIATVFGSILGAKLALKTNPKWIRGLIVACVIASVIALIARR